MGKTSRLLSALLMVLMTSSCGPDPEDSETESESVSESEDLEDLDPFPTVDGVATTSDNRKPYYQLFPYTFADSNGDGIGDFNGIDAKLDYIASMNYEGIWANPIVPSPSYHKYDATDYCAVDSVFGTLDDFDNLITHMHEKGMSFIFDFAINHTSNYHPWFTKACEDWVNGDYNTQYVKYYSFYEIGATELVDAPQWYRQNAYAYVPGSNNQSVYECQFNSSMPDLNLQQVLDDPEGDLATEITNIVKFWFEDHNIDGFRLDAIEHYFEYDNSKNIEFLSWLNDLVKSYKEDAYIVAEGQWSGTAANTSYYQSGIDSVFDFSNYTGEGRLALAVKNNNIAGLTSFMKNAVSYSAPGFAAHFVGNHDAARMVGVMSGSTNPARVKYGHLLLNVLPGSSFNYYGDEAGMAVTDSSNDPNKRLPMPWGDSYTCSNPPGITSYSDSDAYKYGTVAEQLEDEDSVYYFVAKVNAFRRNNPCLTHYDEVATVETATDEARGSKILVQSRSNGEETYYVIINASSSIAAEYDFSSLGDVSPIDELSVYGNSTYRGTTLHIRPYSVVILG